jgi:LysM repeat protein
MQGMREFGNALVIALISICLMVGALSISLVESVPEPTATPTNVQLPSPIPLTATPTIEPTFTLDPLLATATPSTAPTSTITLAISSRCQFPSGWVPAVVQAGDTIDSIAVRYRTTAAELQLGNCLATTSVVPGTILYVPSVVPNTSAACTPGAAGWTKSYTVKPKDTLYSIGTNHYTTVELMRKVNCRVGDTIFPGEVLWVPNVASRTPPASPLPGVTVTPYPTEPLTVTVLPFTITVIPTLPYTYTPPPTSTTTPTQ